MPLKNYYASIAIVEIHGEGKVTIESISVSKGECVLSGAWEFSTKETDKINNVVSGKLIIPLGEETAVKKLLTDSELKFIKAKPFLQEAKQAANDAIAAYEIFKSEDAKKRKKMVEPTFFNWPDDLDFNHSSEYLESIGKMAVPEGTPSDMKKTLAAARLVKYLIDMWQQDEQERGNRKYVEGAEAEITILPESWLNESAPLL
jgi:hypothetical protein